MWTRIFVAGDAAYIHSLIGGQGMNTGLHDAWNLVWKLDLVVRGRGGERLLDSYTEKRRPVIKQVIELTHFMTKAMTTPTGAVLLAATTLVVGVGLIAGR